MSLLGVHEMGFGGHDAPGYRVCRNQACTLDHLYLEHGETRSLKKRNTIR